MKGRIFNVLQRVGKSFMVPIALLPIAGLLLAISMTLTNETMIEQLGLELVLGKGSFLYGLMIILRNVGTAIFNNLPLIFAGGVAMGMAHKEKGVAVLSAILAYLVMHMSINSMLLINRNIFMDGTISHDMLEGTVVSVCGILSLEMGVFGGIIVGLGVAYLHNRFYRIEFGSVLSFFGGVRFVPIISTLCFIVVGVVFYYVWPPVQGWIYALGEFVNDTGYFGTLVFGVVKRLLVPFGLHHVFYLPFWQTAVGGSMFVNGVLVHGGQNIFFAQLADPNLVHFNADATRYFSGEFIFMIFGMPGAALAMYHCARLENRKKVASLLLSAALTSVLTGITEPIEFTFIFVAPILYGVQVILAGSAYMIAHILNIAVGLTFSGGLIDFILFGIMQGNDKTNWLMVIPVGMIYFVLYYIIFRYLIIKFDLKTVGRQKESIVIKSDEKLKNKQSMYLLKGLGGKDNIIDLDCCVTRLRATVVDSAKVNNSLLKQSKAAGIIHQGQSVQVVYGPRASLIMAELEDYMEHLPDEEEHEDILDSLVISNIVVGEVKDMSESSDELFASKVMGDGVVIVPHNRFIYAPCSCRVNMVFPTHHAIGLVLDNGCEMLIHVGVNTVRLNGEGFHLKVCENEQLNQGDLLWELDLDYIKDNALSDEVIVVMTSVPSDMQIKKVFGNKSLGEIIMRVE